MVLLLFFRLFFFYLTARAYLRAAAGDHTHTLEKTGPGPRGGPASVRPPNDTC